jgi:hypothetical protein
MKNTKIELTPKQIVTFFGFIATCLVVAHLLTFIPKYTLGDNKVTKIFFLFNLESEGNIPTFFSALLILSCSLQLFMISALQDADSKNRSLWLGLALVFLFLSFDEAVMFHEHLTRPVRAMLHTSGLFFLAWVIPYAILLGLMTVCYTPFLFRLPKHPRNLMIISAILYISGALVMEMISGWYWDKSGERNLAYYLVATCEEVLEIVGMITFQYALFMYMREAWAHVHIQLTLSRGTEAELPTEQLLSDHTPQP